MNNFADTLANLSVWAQIGLGLLGIVTFFFAYVFVVALVKTIKEFRQSKPAGFNAGVGFGGELGIKHIRKKQTKK
jgi:hypothetical protein